MKLSKKYNTKRHHFSTTENTKYYEKKAELTCNPML